MILSATGALRARLLRALDDKTTVYVACGITLALGLFFLVVWSPLPWGWRGIDHYDERAQRLAAGHPFDTTDVPWGYAYYLAFLYALFGPVPWIPLVVQVLLNASVPLLLYELARPLVGDRTAILSAVIFGIFSFNTVYAATQSSDAICTVLFLASLLLFERGRRSGRAVLFVASGLLVGMATQFRPNLILFAPVLAVAYLLARPRGFRKAGQAALYVGVSFLVLAPWTVRNYRLTGSFLPTSTHGGVQLWYGTLQVGPYLESRADNPRSVFQIAAFDYTSLARLPLIVSALPQGCANGPIEVVYWTDRDKTPHRVGPSSTSADRLIFELPGQFAPTTVYYFFQTRPASADTIAEWTPPEGASAPFIFVVSADHVGDLDRYHELLDIFDVVRLARLIAWNEQLPPQAFLDFNDDGSVDDTDLRVAIDRLAENVERTGGTDVVASLESQNDAFVIRLVDGSTLRIPRAFSWRVTDLEFDLGLASKLTYARRSLRELRTIGPDPSRGGWCGAVSHVAMNDVFYRSEPHLMRRYTALALDNIRRDPTAFAAASLYRAVRLFVIKGGSTWIARAAFVLSLAYLAALLWGLWIAWRRKYPVLPLVLPIVYVPATLAFVLTNMRYTVTVQPYVFTFVAIALLSALESRRAKS